MRINTNLNAMKAIKNSNKNVSSSGNSMKKLISGLSINKAADDAAGLAISEKMRSQIRGLNQAEQNAQDGILMLQTAEGTIEEVGNIVQRMRELAVQGANETNTGSDRAKISEELTQLHEEIDRIAESTQFNGKDLLNGTNTVRVENGHTIINNAQGANDKVTIEVQDGFDFDDLTENDLKVKVTTNGIEFGNNASNKYGIAASDLDTVNKKIKSGSTVTITDFIFLLTVDRKSVV